VQLHEWLLLLCRLTALHFASLNGKTETALALAKAGADVHCKTNGGYGLSGQHPRVVGVLQCAAAGPSTCGGAARVAASAAQEDGASLCVARRPHRDGDGAGEGGRGRGRQGHRRVRFSGLHPRVGWFATVSGRTVRPLRVQLHEWLFGLRRQTALHLASLNGKTETALALAKAGADVHCKTNGGYGLSGQHPRVVGVLQCAAAGPSTRGELHERLLRLCRFTALHCASDHGHTETAMALVKAGADVHCKSTNCGYGYSRLDRRVAGLSQCITYGPSIRGGALGVPAWLCRNTALQRASSNGHTETAMALVKAGADVHCKDNDGCGSRGCSLVSVGLPQCRGGRSVVTGCSCTSGCFGCAGRRRCKWR
jgi:hypothetical protein